MSVRVVAVVPSAGIVDGLRLAVTVGGPAVTVNVAAVPAAPLAEPVALGLPVGIA